MRIYLYEPQLAHSMGFFRILYRALMRHAGAKGTDGDRPCPKTTQPREIETAWIDMDGALVCFDMCDHTFLVDLPALERAAVYFKANLHRPTLDKVLATHGRPELAQKVEPFLFLPPALDSCRRMDAVLRRLPLPWPSQDVCHVVGVYENPVAAGQSSIFEQERPYTPAEYHFWVRHDVQQALKKAGLTGTYRLVSRGNTAIEDNSAVFPNLAPARFFLAMVRAWATVVNTLPHALLPWKAAESLALGRPLVLETDPRTETPEPFRLKPDEHYLALLPELPGFDAAAPLDDPRSYRILARVDSALLQERAAQVAEVVRDRDRMRWMGEQARKYVRERLSALHVAEYVLGRVQAHGAGCSA